MKNVQIELRNLQSWNPKIQVFVIPNLSAKIYALTFDSCSSCLFVSRSARISSDCNWKHNHSPSVRVGENLWTNITLFFWSKGGGQSQIIFLFFSLTTPKDRTRVVSGYKLRAVTNPTTPLVASGNQYHTYLFWINKYIFTRKIKSTADRINIHNEWFLHTLVS